VVAVGPSEVVVEVVVSPVLVAAQV